MASCAYDQYISKWGRCSSLQPSLPLKVMCHQRSSVIEKKNPPPLTYHLSRPLFYLARALKNNHPGHAPLLPIISLIYPHLSLRFPFLLSVFLSSRLPLIVFVFFCPCHCFALAVFCFLPLLFLSFPPCFLFLYLIIAHSFLTLSSLSPGPLLHVVKKFTEPFSQVSTQSSLSDSFILSANNPFNSARLISVYPPPLPTHTPIIYNWILSHPWELLF